MRSDAEPRNSERSFIPRKPPGHGFTATACTPAPPGPHATHRNVVDSPDRHVGTRFAGNRFRKANDDLELYAEPEPKEDTRKETTNGSRGSLRLEAKRAPRRCCLSFVAPSSSSVSRHRPQTRLRAVPKFRPPAPENAKQNVWDRVHLRRFLPGLGQCRSQAARHETRVCES